MIRPETTQQQAEALAGFLVSLRPGQRSWTKAACLDALRAAAANHTRDVELLTRAAVRAALTASIRTPEVIGMTGAHWDGVGDLTTKGEGRKHAQCERCRDYYDPIDEHVCHHPAPDHVPHIADLRRALQEAASHD